MSVKTYRCNHVVEAARWSDTDANREVFAAWFDKHDMSFETRGLEVILPDQGPVVPGEWIVWMDGEFVAMDDDQFQLTYVEGAP